MSPRHLFSFSAGHIGELHAAVDRWVSALGNPTMLGLGEPLHGSEFLLDLRNRIFQRLVQAHGFKAIALESSFPRGHLVNRFVHGEDVAIDEALREGFSHEFGKSPANRALIAWMREYNGTHANTVRFYGFDAPTEMMYTDSPRKMLEFALACLANVDAPAGAVRRAAIDPLLGEDAAWENQQANFDHTRSVGLSANAAALRVEVENLANDLLLRRPDAIAATGADAFEKAVRYVELSRQLLTYHVAVAGNSPTRLQELLALRDAMMADNLLYMFRREHGRGRLFVHAHNAHLQRGKAEWQMGPQLLAWHPAGAHLGRVLANEYAVVGTGIGSAASQRIGEPAAGSIEAGLMQLPGPGRFVLTAEVAREMAPLAKRMTENPAYFPFTAQSFADLTALLMLDSIP